MERTRRFPGELRRLLGRTGAPVGAFVAADPVEDGAARGAQRAFEHVFVSAFERSDKRRVYEKISHRRNACAIVYAARSGLARR
jgi:hypothetical protein